MGCDNVAGCVEAETGSTFSGADTGTDVERAAGAGTVMGSRISFCIGVGVDGALVLGVLFGVVSGSFAVFLARCGLFCN